MASRQTRKLEPKLSKTERKALKKQSRKFLSLQRNENGLKLSDTPTRHIVIGNGGLMCGMERSYLLGLFGRFGHVEELCMIPKKQFALLSYQRESQAMNAYSDINGRLLKCPEDLPKSGVTLYLAYLMDKFEKSTFSKWNIRPVLPSQKELHPPGLILIEDFISSRKERELLSFFKMKSDDDTEKPMKHRKVRHFGYEFIYGKNNIDKEKPLDESIPDICKPIIDKLVDDGVISWKPDQLTVNQYETGQGIPPHTDTHSAFEDGIISLSLGSQVVMDFCHPDGQECPLILPNRSLLLMKGESRYLWTHGITPRKTDIVLETPETSLVQDKLDEVEPIGDHSGWLTLKERGFRISLTFRKVLRGECSCKYPEKCDSQSYQTQQNGSNTSDKEGVFVPKTDAEARMLEASHVHDVYDEIADHFSDTRHSPWPKIANFLKELPPNSMVADVGCGNGKYLGVNKDLLTFGSDRSINLIKICRERGHCAIVGDILCLPYRSSTFDVAISIAVIHHLSTKERRINAVKEIVRIVKPGGLVLISVWAQEQNKDPACEGPHHVEKEAENPNTASCANGTTCSSAKLSGIDNKELYLGKEGILEDGSCGDKERPPSLASTQKDGREKIEINEKRNVFKQQDLLVPWHFRGKPNGAKTENISSKPDVKQTSKKEQVYHRFYHVFVGGELEELFESVGEVEIVKTYHDRGNWCVILKKK